WRPCPKTAVTATSVVAAVLRPSPPYSVMPPVPRDPENENSSGGAVPDSWTVGGKTLTRQRFGHPPGVDGDGRLPRPAKTATSAVAAVWLAARVSRRPKTIESPPHPRTGLVPTTRGIRSRLAQASTGARASACRSFANPGAADVARQRYRADRD